MGLHMRSLTTRLVLVAALTATGLSCMKKPDMDENDTPTSVQEVQSAMAQSWGHADPATMAPNDFLYQETEQKLDQQEPRVALQEGITISKKEETTKEFNYTFLYQAAVITGDQTQQSTREDHRCVARTDDGCAATPSSGSPTTSDTTPAALKGLSRLQAAASGATIKPLSDDLQLTLGFERFLNLAYSCQKSDTLVKYCQQQLGLDTCDIKCSNLKAADETQDAPPLIQSQTNCGGLTDCKVHLKRVSFDWSFIATKGTETHKQKINYTIALSPDMPFFSRVMEYCSRGLVTVPSTGNQVLISVCNRVKNYKAGTAH